LKKYYQKKDIIKYHIIPYVKLNEENRLIALNKLKNSVFTIFFPRKSNIAVIIRYNPRNKTNKTDTVSSSHMLTWNLETNEITPGQWLLNKKIIIKNSNLTDDGKYFIYNLYDAKVTSQGEFVPTYDKKGKRIFEYLTVISKPPYFSGLYAAHHMDEKKDYYHYTPDRNFNGGNMLNDEISNQYQVEFYGKVNVLLKDKLPDNMKIFQREPYKSRESDLIILKNDDLKKILHEKKLKITGIKHDLIKRIIEDDYNEYKKNKINLPLSLRCQLPCQDQKGRMIEIENGFLKVDGQSIYDFTNDEFFMMKPPKDYSWSDINSDINSDIKSEMKLPDIKLPDIKLPEMKLPDIKLPDIKLPDIKLPDIKLPDIKLPILPNRKK
jgi:hypothetical protein